MRIALIGILVSVAGAAHAQDQLESMAAAQVAPQAPGAKLVAPMFRGSAPKTDYQVMLEDNTCYWFSGVSQGNVKKIALYLWKPNSNMFTPRVADIKSASGNATLAYCTKEPGMYRFQAKIEGSGQYAVGVFAKEAAKRVERPDATSNLGKYCDKTASAGAVGAKRQGEFFEGGGNSFGHDDRSDFTVQMEAGTCYWIIGCGEAGRDGEEGKIKALYLYLWGPNDKRITEAKSDSPNPMVGYCAKETGMFKVQAKINSGSGKYKVGVYAK